MHAMILNTYVCLRNSFMFHPVGYVPICISHYPSYLLVWKPI